MTIKRIINGKTCYRCSECLLYYKNKKMAEKCEEWCKNHKSCNIEIIKHSIKIIEKDKRMVKN